METIDELESERNEQRQDEQCPGNRGGTANVVEERIEHEPGAAHQQRHE
jgi:hypothetical protein